MSKDIRGRVLSRVNKLHCGQSVRVQVIWREQLDMLKHLGRDLRRFLLAVTYFVSPRNDGENAVKTSCSHRQ